MYVKKITSFCQVGLLKKVHAKKLVPFFLPHGVDLRLLYSI